MQYKVLKHQQLTALVKAGQYSEYVAALKGAELSAFGGDIRNLIFDKEIGTNVLSGLMKAGATQIIQMATVIKKDLGD
jgi:hypothetical protein